MKKIYLGLLVCFIFFNGFAQEPELFKTWHLFRMDADLGEPQFVENIDPLIFPYLTINESLEFNGFGACNSFSGLFVYGEEDDTLTPINFTKTNEDCIYPEHIGFEEGYFFQFSDEQPLYIVDIIETLFAFDLYPGFTYTFSNEPLSLNNYNLIPFKIYPNPVINNLHISSENINIERLNIYSITGQKVLKQHTINNTVDVSNLSKGMYFIEIFTSEGNTVKKFIKK